MQSVFLFFLQGTDYRNAIFFHRVQFAALAVHFKTVFLRGGHVNFVARYDSGRLFCRPRRRAYLLYCHEDLRSRGIFKTTVIVG